MKSAPTQMLEDAAGSHADAADSSASNGRRKRVLLIEDESATRLALLQKLRLAGFDVDVAVNGRLALEKIRTGHSDAIFMDLLLPGVKGVDVIKAARRDSEFANRPIYVCTSAARMGVWTRRGTKAGATKVFDRASTPIDAIVAEVAADLLGCGTSAKPPDGKSSNKTESEDRREIRQPLTHCDNNEPIAAKSPVQPLTFMKRVVKTLGLDWINHPAGESGAPASLEPIQPDQEPMAGTPAAGFLQNQTSAGADWLSLKPGNRSGKADASQLGGMNVTATDLAVGVLTLDEGAKILSASKNCTGMFGWESSALVGQNLKLLLKDDLEQDIRKLLQHKHAGSQSKLACPLLTVARRKDGTEFPVSVSTVTWSSDTTLMGRSDTPQFCWTAFIRERAGDTDFQRQAATALGQRSQPANEKSMSLAADVTQLQEHSATLQKANEGPQQQLQEISNEATLRHEEPTKREQERGDLAGRIFESQVELNRAKSELEHETEERKQLEQKLQELGIELEKQTQERGRLEAEWREQLKNAETLTKKLEAGWLEETGRNKGFEERLQMLGNGLSLEQAERSKRFEQEVLTLRNERDELHGKLTSEQLATAEFKLRTEELETRLRDSAAEAERVKAELEDFTAEQGRLESEWCEKLNTAESLSNKLETAWVEEVEHNNRSEVELTGLRQVRDDLNGKLAGEQQAAAESRRRNDVLATRVIENAVELERIKAELEKAGRNEQFEERLKGLEQVREELGGELRMEQQATAESRQRTEELESRLLENDAELERVKADADKHSEEQARLESELYTQLDLANSAAEQAEAAFKEKVAQCSQFETQLATLEQLRNELAGKLATEQQATAESRQRGEELEKRLRESAAELERVKADRDKQAEEQARQESELRQQLGAAKAAAEQAETALNEQTGQNRGFEDRLRVFGNNLSLQQVESTARFENELTSLQQVRDELGGKLTTEQQATTEARQRSEELGNRLRETAAELERVQAELTRHAEERAQLESEQRAQLNAAKAATEKAEAAWLEEAERSKRFEEEVAGLQQERDALNNKFITGQQAVAESRKHSEELENRLRETTAELERVHAELTRHAEEWSHLEAEQLAQRNSRQTAIEQAEAAWLEEAGRSNRFEKELASLRQERDELNHRLTTDQRAVVESRRHDGELENRLRETAAELERVKAELARHAEERAHMESNQRTQLDAAKGAAEQAAAALTQKAAQCNQFKDEAAILWKECEALSAKLATEQQAAVEFKRRSQEFENRLLENDAELEAAKASKHQQAEEQKRLEAEWREQLNKAQTSTARGEDALKEAVAKQRQLDRSLVNLRNERLEVCDRFKAEHAAGEKSKRRIAELEKRLRERAKSELEKQAAERGRLESEWRAQLETARAMAERELGSLRQEREALSGKLTAEQQAAGDFKRRSEEFEGRLHENAAELERVKAELDQHAKERSRLESEHRNFADTKDALGRELRHLRENEATHKAEVAEMEGRLAEGMALLARAMADLETERGERHRLEQRAASLAAESQKLHEELRQHLESEQASEHRITGLLQQIREREDALTSVSLELQKETLDRQTAEEQLRATADLSDQLRNHLSLIEEAKKAFASREQDLEVRLHASLNALRESESSAEKETAEHRHLEESLHAAQRENQRQDESNAIELSKLKSAMQVEQLERKSLEALAVQSRYSSLDSARVGAAMVNGFRNQIRQPIDKLMHSARRLLEIHLEEEPKKLVESLLKSALLLQTSLREGGSLNADSAGDPSENPRESSAPRSPDLISNEASSSLRP